MNIGVVYHSSTGNTGHCVEVLKEEMENSGHACATFAARDARGMDLKQYDLLGFASAVYGFRPAHAMLAFLRDMRVIERKPVFALVCCSMLAANSLNRMAKMLRLKGAHILGGIEVRGEEAWPAVRFPGLIISKGRPNTQDDESIREFTRDLLQRYEQEVSGKQIAPPSFRRFSPWGLIGALTARPVMRYAMLGKALDEDRCTRCGLCAENCPMGAIRLDPYPQFASGCMGCFGCVNLCPEEAISTPLTWGRVRYKGYGADSGRD